MFAVDERFSVSPGFDVTIDDILAAVASTNAELRNVTLRAYQAIDMGANSNIVGSFFCVALASQVGGAQNPNNRGHPDLIPAEALALPSSELMRYPFGIEIKVTMGTMQGGEVLTSGVERVATINRLQWQAHHRRVNSLLGLVCDFVGGDAAFPEPPSITGVFYSDELEPDDWSKLSRVKEEHTVSSAQMLASGRRKMARGAVAIAPRVSQQYAKCLSVDGFPSLTLDGLV